MNESFGDVLREAIGTLEKMAEQLGRPNPSLGDAMPQNWIPDKP